RHPPADPARHRRGGGRRRPSRGPRVGARPRPRPRSGGAMTRTVTLGAAQLGPIPRDHSRKDVVERLLDLLRRGADHGCDLVVFPELALTTFFPRWYVTDEAELDQWYETAMPGPETQVLFDEAA